MLDNIDVLILALVFNRLLSSGRYANVLKILGE